MKIGIMQPYFFPYLGYFSLIEYTEKFIFFDTPQYISHGWINRNRILKQNASVGYITVPVRKAPRETAIKDIYISNSIDWKEKICGQLHVYKKKAPFYRQTMDVVKSVLDESNGNLSRLCIKSIVRSCEYLGIKRDFDIFSQMPLEIGEVTAPDEWALQIAKKLNANIYVNPPGGMSFFDAEKYRENHIGLEFLQSELKPYIQRIGKFIPGLSIIDVMMFNSVSEINKQINSYTITRA